MFKRIDNTEDWKYGEQKLCCVKLLYLAGVRVDEDVVPIDIYVRCYVAKIKGKFDDGYLVTFCDHALGNAERHHVVFYNNNATLPALYEIPLLWALSGRVITFEENGKVNFALNAEGKPLSIMDLFENEECIDREHYRDLCLKYHCMPE